MTLAIVSAVVILLPGFFAILLWNVRARRFAVNRPDLPINALSVLAIGVGASLIAHLMTGLGIKLIQELCTELGRHLPFSLGPAINPIVIMAVIAQGGVKASSLTPYQFTLGMMAPLISTSVTLAFMADDAIDVATEGWDFGGHGWAYSHIIRPAQHGHRPIAYVLTELQHDGLGVGYRGVIADFRQSGDGQTQSLALASPSRFLFEIKPRSKTGHEPELVRYEERPAGDIISLDQKVIHDVVVTNPSTELLRELRKLEAERETAST